jgi:hypothetical protein
MDPSDVFLCNKYACTLTRQSCADRQAARIAKPGSRLLYNTYPGCQECSQGKIETQGIMTKDSAPRQYGRNNKTGHKTKKQSTGGANMSYPNKIDDEKLKIMIAGGKFIDEIAAEFGVVKSSVAIRIKRLGLTANYRRQKKGAPSDNRKPVRQSADVLTYKKPVPAAAPVEGQIIPVTLRLTVEVNVRVSVSDRL